MSECAITGVLVKDLPNFEQLNDRKMLDDRSAEILLLEAELTKEKEKDKDMDFGNNNVPRLEALIWLHKQNIEFKHALGRYGVIELDVDGVPTLVSLKQLANGRGWTTSCDGHGKRVKVTPPDAHAA
tara:strand:+ start:304 stop:684 length:381 start_codon:yes stop_codon:yes gene_type:complete